MNTSLSGIKPARFASRVKTLGTEEAFRFGGLIHEVETRGGRIIRCNLGQPDFPTPKHVTDAVIDAIRRGFTTYCDPQGLPELRQAVAESVGTSRGLSIDPDRVCVFPGGRSAIGLGQQAYVQKGDEIVYPTPCYPLFESFIRYVSATPRPVPLQEEHGFSMRPEDLEPFLGESTRLIYLNYPANPTGGVASRAELEALAELIRRKAPPDVRVYSDESYEAIVFDGREHCSIASMPGMEERTIIASGASKTYSWTGGRVGWAVYPTVEEALVHRNLNINYYASIPPYNQMGARAALESPESPPAIEAMVESFERRRDIVVEALNGLPGVHCQKPKGAFYVFPNISGALEHLGAPEIFETLPAEVRATSSPATLFQLFLLYRYRLATMDRRSFGVLGSEGQHFLRLSIATGEGDLRRATRRLERATRDIQGFQDFVRSGERLALY